ncbi:hypothetical protein GCM10027062_28880 [Nocardioides hungaricus]
MALRDDDYSIVAAFLSADNVALIPSLYRPDNADVVALSTQQELGARRIYFIRRPDRRSDEVDALEAALARLFAERLPALSPVTGN